MALANAFIVGPPKVGSTTLYSVLRQHPDVFASTVKEPLHFVAGGYGGPRTHVDVASIDSRAAYERLFDGASGESVRLEASTHYAVRPETPGLIAAAVPDARIIFLLRDPTDRAISAFRHARRVGTEPFPDLMDALEAEPRRVEQHWTPMVRYVTCGRYASHIDRWSQHVDRDRMLLLLFDDLVQQPEQALDQVTTFLGISALPTTNLPRANAASGARSTTLARLAHAPPPSVRRVARRLLSDSRRARIYQGVRRANIADAAPVDAAAVRAFVTEHVADDVRRLEQRLGRDLSAWLTPAPSSTAAGADGG